MHKEKVKHLDKKAAQKYNKNHNCKVSMNELTVNLSMPGNLSEICCRSIALENRKLERSNTDISCTKDGLKIHITASDLSAMRAALNTYMRWVILCCELTQ